MELLIGYQHYLESIIKEVVKGHQKTKAGLGRVKNFFKRDVILNKSEGLFVPTVGFLDAEMSKIDMDELVDIVYLDFLRASHKRLLNQV